MITAWSENIFYAQRTTDEKKMQKACIPPDNMPRFVRSDEKVDVPIRKRNVSHLNYTLNHIYQYMKALDHNAMKESHES